MTYFEMFALIVCVVALLAFALAHGHHHGWFYGKNMERVDCAIGIVALVIVIGSILALITFASGV